MGGVSQHIKGIVLALLQRAQSYNQCQAQGPKWKWEPTCLKFASLTQDWICLCNCRNRRMSGEHWTMAHHSTVTRMSQKAWVPLCTWTWDTFKHGGFYLSRIHPRISTQLCWLCKALSFTWHTTFNEPPATGLITWISQWCGWDRPPSH